MTWKKKSSPSSAGTPQPDIVWYKDAVLISPVKIPRYRVLVGGSLQINGLLPDDTGMFQCFARNLAGEIQTNTYLAVTSMSLWEFSKLSARLLLNSVHLPFLFPPFLILKYAPLFSFLILFSRSMPCLLHPSIYISLFAWQVCHLECMGNYWLFLNQRMCRRSRQTEVPCQFLRAVPENETWQPPLLSSLLSSQQPSALLVKKSVYVACYHLCFTWFFFFCVCVADPSCRRYRSQHHRWPRRQRSDWWHVSHSALWDLRSPKASHHLAERCVG